MSIAVKLNNLYTDREITGEAFLRLYKAGKRFIHENLPNENRLSNTIRSVSRIALAVLLSPLIFIGMVIKCLNVSQVISYNEKIRENMLNREPVMDYPRQPEAFYWFPIQEQLLPRLNDANEAWERLACNILRYRDNEASVQFIKRECRWKIPEGVVRPFAS